MCFTLPYVTAPPIPVIRSNANNKPTNRIEKKNASLSLTTIADKAATPPTKIVIMLRPTSQKNTTFNLHESCKLCFAVFVLFIPLQKISSK